MNKTSMINKDGFLLLHKDKNISSFKAVEKARYKLGVKKAGHGGTLDVQAEGLLIVGLGFGTKLLQYVLGMNKTYIAGIIFGLSTNTLDLDGDIIENINASPELESIKEILPVFQGKIIQEPPMFSALKKNGKPLYKLARRGGNIDMKERKREITVFELNVLNYELLEQSKLDIEVKCSSGTYIRSLARDMGSELGLPSSLYKLLRTEIGEFSLENAVTLEELSHDHIIPCGEFIKKLDFKCIEIDDTAANRFLNGNYSDISRENIEKIAVYSRTDFIGIGKITDERLIPYKVCCGDK